LRESIARKTRRGALAGWLVAASALGAGAAEAARLVDVRVGRHPDFVRVVFETDAPAAFVVERGEPGESRVRIEAGGAPGAVAVPPGAGAEVILEPLPGGGTLARIRAAAPVRIESQVLDRPPRIVFDLRPGADEEAAVPAPPEPVFPLEPAAAEEPPVSPPEPAVAEPVLAPEVESPPILPDLARPLAESPELELPAAELPGPEPPAPAEAPTVAETPPTPPAESRLGRPGTAGTPESPEPAREPPTGPSEPALPPVSAAPPAALALRLDDRSLLLGAAGGLALGLGVALLARGRRGLAVTAPAMASIAVEQIEPVEEALESAPDERAAAPEPAAPEQRPPLPMAPWPESEPLAADLLVMIQRLDDRCVAAEQAVAGLVERTERLERRSGAEAEELASQRVALARLDLALGRPLSKPEARPSETAAATPPPRTS